MFFTLSKLLTPLERPGDLLLLCLVVGSGLTWFVRSRRAGIILMTAVTLILTLIAIFPIADMVAAPLENRFPRPLALPDHVDGLIVLGGGIDPVQSSLHGFPNLNAEGDRMTEFVRLAKLYPGARLVFSGGSGVLDAHLHPTEASAARAFFSQQGLDVKRVIFEDHSRNTYENVLYSKPMAKPRDGEIWLLIASAQDVPRCMGIFHKLGWPVLPVPVSYKTGGPPDFSGHLRLLDRSSHEWLGLLIYWLTGKSDQLFPSPQKP